jgi:Clp amino terminal domain, pathogenicity island component
MRIRLNRPCTFADDARTVMVHSGEHARRLGHSHRGGEHYLLALAAADLPVAAVLRERGVTPGRVEEEIVRLEGLGPAAALFAGLDTGTLAAVGVDLGAVRDRIEASFGPDALARAGRVTQKQPRRPSGLNPKSPRPMRTGPVGRWRNRRQAGHAVPLPPIPPAPPGLYQAPGPRPAGGIPPAPDACYAVHQSVVEATILRDGTLVRAEHLALAFTAMTTGLVPPILSALGTSAPALRAAILEQLARRAELTETKAITGRIQ